MRVLFVGFGDLAQRSAGLFVAAGWQVTGLRRSPGDFPGVATVAGDCHNVELMTGLVGSHDLVVVSLTPDSYTEQGYRDAYVTSAEALKASIENALQAPKLLLWVSSTSVYGEADGEWVDESTPAYPNSFSGRALLDAEKIIGSCPVPSTVVRFSGIYGPGRERLLGLVREGQCAPATPVQWTNRIHADDCAGVLFHLAQIAFSGGELLGLYLGTDCEPVPLHDVHRWLACELGVEFRTREGNSGRGSRRCSNRRLLDTGYQFSFPTYREGYRSVIAS